MKKLIMKQLWQRLSTLFSLFRKRMINTNHISISIYTEKKVEHGEDAPPLLVEKESSFAVGVFDGMGGAGAANCDSAYGENFSKAYVASRIVKETVQAFLIENLGLKTFSAEKLKNTILERLNKEQELFPPRNKSILRSKLVREYPTTLAIVTLQENEKTYQVDSYWAGDSHCYLWTKDGFFQISKDDLEENNDPMENLHNDSPISNCICADRDFTIHHNPIQIEKEPTIILCATDGCFGYYQTPMHFEYVLKSCLQKAKNKKEWEQLVTDEVLKVTGDDCSLSLIARGYSSFEELKKSMKFSHVIGFPQLVEQEQTIAWAEQELAKEKEIYEQNKTTGWNSYKQKYMKYINNDDNGNA